jgi:hypothetical protein
MFIESFRIVIVAADVRWYQLLFQEPKPKNVKNAKHSFFF